MPQLNSVSREDYRYSTRFYSKGSNSSINPTTPRRQQQTFTAEQTSLKSPLSSNLSNCAYADHDVSWFLANGVLPVDVQTCQLGLDMSSEDKTLPIAALTPVQMPGTYVYKAKPAFFERESFNFYSSSVQASGPPPIVPHSLLFNGNNYAFSTQPVGAGRKGWSVSFRPQVVDREQLIFSSYTDPDNWYYWYLDYQGNLGFYAAGGSAEFPIVLPPVSANEACILSWYPYPDRVDFCFNRTSSVLVKDIAGNIELWDPDTFNYGLDGQVFIGSIRAFGGNIYNGFLGEIGRVSRFAGDPSILNSCALSNSDPTTTPPIDFEAICDFYEGSGNNAAVQVGSAPPESYTLSSDVVWNPVLPCFNPCNFS